MSSIDGQGHCARPIEHDAVAPLLGEVVPSTDSEVDHGPAIEQNTTHRCFHGITASRCRVHRRADKDAGHGAG